ncbi:MAG: aminotransferase class V-fold PLP-dependent enzyme [Phycisphaerales bacterium]|nr:aminotransferase class V-fold PLP-dependent enzyme [Phycisphaerales bacterium]
MSRVIYLDNNATTRVDERVIEAMVPLLRDRYGNPSSTHHFGAQVTADIEQARSAVATLIGARDSEIVFTSGGTEADNAAVRGVLSATPHKRHLVVSAVEHAAILDMAAALEREGVRVTRVGVDRAGRVEPEAVAAAICEDTALISVMLANNETGVIAPLDDICAAAASRGVPVHTDAVNALGKMPVDVQELGVSLLSLSAHKIHGPKGVGALYVRRGTPFRASQLGGHQERDRRGGTLNAPGIAALGAACEILRESSADCCAMMLKLRNRLEEGLLARFERIMILGESAMRLPNTTCACIAGVEAEAVLLLLSERGICASSGAACSSGSLEASHVVKAMGVPAEYAHGQLRFSLGRENTQADVDALLEVLPAVVERVAGVRA